MGTPSLTVPQARAAAAGAVRWGGVQSRHCFSVLFSYVMQIFAVKLFFGLFSFL